MAQQREHGTLPHCCYSSNAQLAPDRFLMSTPLPHALPGAAADATVLVQQQQAHEQLEQQQQWEYMMACYGLRPPIPALPAIPEDAAAEEEEVLPNGQPSRRSWQPGTLPPQATAVMNQVYEPAGANTACSNLSAQPQAVAEGRSFCQTHAAGASRETRWQDTKFCCEREDAVSARMLVARRGWMGWENRAAGGDRYG